MSKHFELLILGGGPGGYSAALAAARGKKKVALFECEHLGGTCLNVGCIPTKYLLDKAAALEKIRAMTQKNLLRDAGSFSFRNMQAGKGEVVDKLVGGVEFLLKKQGVTTVRGEAKLLPDRRVLCNGEEYDGDAIIIATGSEPILPPIPGVEHTLDSTGVLALSHLPRSLAVIGGGVIGLELASAYASFGTAVSVIEMQSSLLPNELPKAAAQLSSALKKRGIGIHTGFSVKRIETRENGYAVVAGQGETEREFLADVVLMAIGRKPALRGVDAKALNLAMTPRGAIAVDDHLCTNLPGVYAIGDVIGGYQLAHAAYAEGEAAVAHLLGRDEALDETVMPRCIYTMPCFAAVGKTPAQIADLGRETRIGSFSYEGNGMALAEGASGTVYVIMDAQTTETLGVQIVGENSSELISFAALAVADHTTLPLWEKMIVAHPSLSEMLREAALDAFQRAIHKV